MGMLQGDAESRPRRESMRGASRKAAVAMAEQLAPSPPESPAKAPLNLDPFGSPVVSSNKGAVKNVYGGRKGFKGNDSKSKVTPVHISHKSSKKRALSESEGISSDEESILSTLTSLPPSPKSSHSTGTHSRNATKASEPETPSRRRVNSTSAGHSQRKKLQHTQSTPIIPISAKSHAPLQAAAHSSPAKPQGFDSTNVAMRTGNRVWLRIGVESKALATDVPGDEEWDEFSPQEWTMWWPGFISKSVRHSMHLDLAMCSLYTMYFQSYD